MEKKKPRILLIEDDEYSRQAIEHLLNAISVHCVLAATCREKRKEVFLGLGEGGTQT
jgi:response regulator RpfG family c-di-GMP phosphodiesterase